MNAHKSPHQAAAVSVGAGNCRAGSFDARRRRRGGDGVGEGGWSAHK